MEIGGEDIIVRIDTRQKKAVVLFMAGYLCGVGWTKEPEKLKFVWLPATESVPLAFFLHRDQENLDSWDEVGRTDTNYDGMIHIEFGEHEVTLISEGVNVDILRELKPVIEAFFQTAHQPWE